MSMRFSKRNCKCTVNVGSVQPHQSSWKRKWKLHWDSLLPLSQCSPYKDKRQGVLRKMWAGRRYHAALMRMQCSSPILKSSAAVSQTATWVPYNTTCPLVGTHLKDCADHRDTCISLVIVLLFTLYLKDCKAPCHLRIGGYGSCSQQWVYVMILGVWTEEEWSWDRKDGSRIKSRDR